MAQFHRLIARLFFAFLILSPMPGYSVSTKLAALPLQSSDSFDRRIQLEVNGQPLNILLNSSYVTDSTTVYDRSGAPLENDLQFFTGQVEGDSNSWVRLSLNKHQLNGVISRHGQRYKVATVGHDISIKPLADSGHGSHATGHSLNHRTLRRALTVNPELAGARTEVSRIAEIGIVVDSQYNQAHNGAGLEKALSIINAVDGIYREEFGLALKVVSAINITDTEADPFNYGRVPIETMLRNFRDYRMQSGELTNTSLVHLFTGNTNLDEPVGLAWINTACRNDGYDVGISRPYRHDILLAAHEIAHNLGAHHDSDTQCGTETDKVMWPYISSQTSQHFSSCTHAAVKRSLESSCHARAIDLHLSLSSTSGNSISANVRNNDRLLANPSATVTFAIPQGNTAIAVQGNCESPTHNVSCSIGTLLPGQREQITIQLANVMHDTQTLLVTLKSAAGRDAHLDNNTASVTSTESGALKIHNPDNIAAQLIAPSGGHSGIVGGGSVGAGGLTFLALLLVFSHHLRRAAGTAVGHNKTKPASAILPFA